MRSFLRIGIRRSAGYMRSMRACTSWRAAFLLVWVSLAGLLHGQEPYRAAALGVTIPGELGGLPLVHVTDFEKKDPGLGVGLSFRGEGGVKADIYIYNARVPSIPGGIKSKLMIDHFYAVTGDVMEMERRGVYKNVQTIVPQEEVSIGGIKFFHANLRFTSEGVPMDSHVYLTGLKGQFVKIRFSFPVAREKTARETQHAFLDQLGQVLSGAPGH